MIYIHLSLSSDPPFSILGLLVIVMSISQLLKSFFGISLINLLVLLASHDSVLGSLISKSILLTSEYRLRDYTRSISRFIVGDFTRYILSDHCDSFCSLVALYKRLSLGVLLLELNLYNLRSIATP